ncbi:MAG: DUF2027 domain-containing protein [Muribaculaceae bacterium]|nr:DUF2027 domain-containing protein [Muribaculaceae bacterium]
MAKIGDIVRFLNDVGGGKVVRIKDSMAYVEDEDGFENPVLLRECVVVQTAEQVAAAQPKPKAPLDTVKAAPKTAPGSAPKAAPKAATAPAPVNVQPEERLDTTETGYGDVLNMVLGFEAADVQHLSNTTYECSLVNDSNYYVCFTFSTRSDDDPAGEWTLRYAGTVEPNIQVSVGEFEPGDVALMDRMLIQAFAFKKDKAFKKQAAIDVEVKADTTKFFKFHCFKRSEYFDAPAIAFDIVRDGKPVVDTPVVAPEKPVVLTQEQLRKGMMQKARRDMRPATPKVSKPKAAPGEPIEVDLHIDALIDNTHGLSSSAILNYQIDKFREVMDENLKNRGQKIIFIHGKGEGVLRQALGKELKHRYKNCDVQDASFAQYGYGATQVTIR